ncbi:MAG: TonB family protein [Bryobacteraceae bacterium]
MFGRRRGSFGASLLLHATVFGMAVYGPDRKPAEERKTVYQRVFAANEKKLVWYRFNAKLPEVSPLERRGVSRPPRAESRNPDQTIVSKPEAASAAKQMTWLPAPRLKLEQDLNAPNLLAFEAPKVPARPERPVPKVFVPPPVTRAVQPSLQLPDAPQPAASPITARNPFREPERPKPREFVPPPRQQRSKESAMTAIDAPQLASTAIDARNLFPSPARPKPREFVAPPVQERPKAPAMTLPEAPQIAASQPLTGALPINLPARPRPRDFTPPSSPAQPQPAMMSVTEAPPLPAGAASLTAAVVGLNPSPTLDPVIPEGARPAKLAAAPEVSPAGGDGEPVESARIIMPDLMIRRKAPQAPPPAPTLMARAMAAPTSSGNLLAVARAAAPHSVESLPSRPSALRVTSPPDPRLRDRVVYTMAIQMPNVTSYTGSWMIWFAEREQRPGQPGDMRAPVPLRKVDPPYAASAMADRVEGRVRLMAVIRKDGHVDTISVIHGVDERLDRSAVAAFGKWEFQPAFRDGAAVDVDAIIEIPFRLAPPPGK